MEFKLFDKEDARKIDDALKNISYNGSEYQYSYLKAWFSYNGEIRFAEENGIYFLRFAPNEDIGGGEMVFFPPIATMDRICEGYNILREYCKSDGGNMTVIGAPRSHAALLDADRYVADNNINSNEYLYATRDLIELKGKKYHAKRNHIAKFKKQYQYIFRAYTETDRDRVLELFEIWQERKNEEYSWEEFALRNYLEEVDGERVFAAVLEADGRIIAFTLGELTGSNLGIVHIEKADISYDGVYAAINNFFVSEYLKDARLINRQEDMGIEGLRKAKQSYYPIGFAEKWRIKSI